jgi:hypothetical protein
VPKKGSKGLHKDKRARAPSKQPICGLHAAAKCAGVNLKAAADVEDFRKKCFAHGSPSALGFFSFLSYCGREQHGLYSASRGGCTSKIC